MYNNVVQPTSIKKDEKFSVNRQNCGYFWRFTIEKESQKDLFVLLMISFLS